MSEQDLNDELRGGLILVVICFLIQLTLILVDSATFIPLAIVFVIEALIVLIMLVRYIQWTVSE